MKLSKRASSISESATLKVSRRAKELAAQGVEVLDLSAGEPDFDSPKVAVAAVKRALDEGRTRYTAAAGIPELREELAARYREVYGAPWRAADIVVTVGAKAGLMELALALCEEGDEVVVPSPCWVSIPEQIGLAGGRAVLAPASHSDGFRMRAESILARLTPASRGILVNSPCNPTGGVLLAEDLRTLVEAAADRGLWVICDETYERFLYGGLEHASGAALAAEFPETVIVVGSFSKTYAMTGWRAGWVAGPPAVTKAVIRVQSHATSNATTFAMYGALEALRSAEPDVQRMLGEFEQRRNLVAERLNAIEGVSCAPPSGAFYAFPRVAECYGPGRQGSVELSQHLLEQARVAVVPGVAFGDDNHVRISFAAARDTLERALERMAEVLAR